MEFNINNETFLKAYNCLKDANTLLENGLGNFNELGSDTLDLINKSNVQNADILDFFCVECLYLEKNMYDTIKILSEWNEDFADYFSDILPNDFSEDFADYLNEANINNHLFYDENFINKLEDEINAALLEDDRDGNDARHIDSIQLMEKGDGSIHTMEDTLYVKLSSGHKYYINIKGQVNNNSLVHVMHQGAYDGSPKTLDNLYKNHCDDVENGIFIRMVSACGEKGKPEELDANTSIVKVISDTFSIPFNNTTIEGFSGAQGSVMHIAADIARETGKAPVGISLVECHGDKPHPWSDEDAMALNDVNAVIYGVYSYGNGDGHATKSVFTKWGEKYPGINLVYIDRNIGGHENIFLDYLGSDMLGFLSNDTQFPSQYYESSSKQIFDVNNMIWVDYDMTTKKNSDVFVQLSNNNIFSEEFGDYNEDAFLLVENDDDNNLEDNLFSDDSKVNVLTTNNNGLGMLYDQSQYKDIEYAGDTLASNGCGFFSVLSAVTAKTGHKFSQSEIESMANDVNMAEKNGKLSKVDNKGRMEYLMTQLSVDYNFTWSKGPVSNISSSLSNGNAVISLINSSSHFVPMTGILENGNVIVNDSDGNKYRSDVLLRERVDQTGFNLDNNELKISAARIDKDGDGLDDDVWYLNFDDSVNLVKLSENEINNIDNEKGNFDKNSEINANLSYNEVPLYFQTDYPDVRYGPSSNDTVASDGCGVTSLSMVASYLTGDEHLPDELAQQFASKATGNGSCWTLFRDSQEPLGIKVDEQTGDWNKAYDALKNGQVVIANAKEQSVFTSGGHFIVLTGLTEDGKVIVNDPYKGNYERTDQEVLIDGFKNGFDPSLFDNKGEMEQFWIYKSKDTSV